MKDTRNNLVNFYAALRVAETLTGKSENIVKFQYAVQKNLQKLKEEIESLKKANQYLPEYLEYDKKRIELCEKHANKDDRGKAKKIKVGRTEMYDLLDENGNQKAEFTQDYDALQESHAPALKAREEQLVLYNKLLEEEVEMDIYKVPLSYFPEDVVGSEENKKNLFKLLLPMVKEEDTNN